MTETLQERMLRLLRQAGVDPALVPIDGPIDETGYAQVCQPLEAIDDRIVTDWHQWNDDVPPELIDQIVASFHEYQKARIGPVRTLRGDA